MSKKIQELFETPDALNRAFNENGYLDDEHKVSIKEAFGTRDAPILFPKIISNTLREAAEPVQLVTPLLDVVRIGSRSLEIPAVNALQAAEIPEGQEYPEQALVFERQVEGKVSKKGVKVVFTEEVINDSLWDIVGLHVRAAGRAMTRLKEQIALKRFKDAATVRFDNSGAVETSGTGIDGLANGAMSWLDFLEMAAVIHAENHVPTDVIMHPLMWPTFLYGTPFNNAYNPGAGWNQNVSSKSGVANSTAPLGMNVMLSPFVSYTAADGATPAKSDIFMIDRNEVGALLVREDMSVDEWDDLSRDIRSIKMKERYDIVAYGDGEGIVVAKDVALTPNYEIALVNNVNL